MPNPETDMDLGLYRSPAPVLSDEIKDKDLIGGPSGELNELLRALQAMRLGDFSVRMPGGRVGLMGKIADTFNEIVVANERMAQQLGQVGRLVGHEGETRHRVKFGIASGAWDEMENSINILIDDLLWPTAEITRAIAAVAQGDLLQSVRLDVGGRPLQGEFLRCANLVNTMIKQLNVFASEVTRVAREVGTEGKLGGQAQVCEVTGVWKELTESVNSLASNLTAQVRNIAEVTIAVANGDLSKKITVDVRGEILQLKEAINTMVDQLRSFASEVTRVSREVGTDGKLGGQAIVHGVAGTWKDLTDSVNAMCGNLTAQVRNIAQVTTAVARGDLSRKIAVDVSGEILELKETINTMVDQLNAFASEVTRVAREVGTEGKLGGQAVVPGVAGTWKDLTDNVNLMGGNLTAQVRNIAEVTTAVARGDLSKKITVNVSGEMLQLKETINTMVDQLNAFASEVTRVAREVGTCGKLGGQAIVPGVAGTWKDLTDSVNAMCGNLTAQVRNIAQVTTAVARGDLSRKIAVDVRGEILELKETINTMVDQLNAFASEVTRVAREVGTEGKLGGQAVVPGVAGTWKDLTDTVNVMAANLTEQVRGIVKVVTAVANGDLKHNLTVKSKGEVAALAQTINNMIDTLATFADQVTTVAREVGVEGRLGGQANVPGAAGIWKDLTGNVNLLAANLTTQVRAIAEVATAVAKGDLSRSIQVDARGEVAELKDDINTMIGNLRITTDINTEQDWLKTNLAGFTDRLQGQRDLSTVGRLLLRELAPLVNAQQGVIYRVESESAPGLQLLAAYADDGENGHVPFIAIGEGLIGQAAADKRRMLITPSPVNAIPISSALFRAIPHNVLVLPILFESHVKAVIELASVNEFSALQIAFLEQLTGSIGIVLNSIEATMQLEQLNRELEARVADRTAALAESNARFIQSEQLRTLALAAGHMGTWDWDVVQGKGGADDGQYRIFGVDRQSFAVTVENVRSLIHPDDWDRLTKAFAEATQNTPSFRIEFRVRRPNGELRWCTGTAAASFEGGLLVWMSGVTIDITDRKEAEERQTLLAREVDHRARNALAVVKSVVRLTRASSIDGYVAAVEGRIDALARAHALLSNSRWQGADISELVEEEIAPYRSGQRDKIDVTGPKVVLKPAIAQSLALAVHELATNAAKYGALSAPMGRVRFAWQVRSGNLVIDWSETGGPPVEPPSTTGYGSRLIDASIGRLLNGTATFDWRREGLHCTLSVPLNENLKLTEQASSGLSTPLREQAVAMPRTLAGNRLLLVEDEALIAMATTDMLIDLGFEVVGVCNNVTEALAFVTNQDIDAALLDVSLGSELIYPVAEYLNTKGVPFVFMTGYGADAIDDRFAGHPVLQKPIRDGALQNAFVAVRGPHQGQL